MTIAGSPVITDENHHFRLTAPVIPGSNRLPIIAIDAYGNTTNQHVQVTVSGNSSQTLIYDGNRNLTSDGNKTYEWDAANRLTAINYTGTNERTEFTYNGLSQRVKIVEKDNGNVTSTRNLIWCLGDAQPCEERDGTNTVTKRYYPQGMRVGTTSYYYTRDHRRIDDFRRRHPGVQIPYLRFGPAPLNMPINLLPGSLIA